MPKTKKLKKNYTYAVGRRRNATARVRVYKGENENLVNDMVIGKYFTNKTDFHYWQKPLNITGNLSKYYFSAKIYGGGKKGQIEALVLALSRALVKINEKFKPILKKEKLLTRDPRTRERRKVGKGGKARRAKQSPKR